jgi:hypothetical protein
MTNDLLADRLEAGTGEVLSRWRGAVRSDQRIRSDSALSQRELTDHVPQIVEEICELMRFDQEPSISTTDEARANVYIRVRQGYSGPELVWELSLLRMTLLGHLAELQPETQLGIDLHSYARLSRIVNLYIDLELRYAISVYTDIASGEVSVEDFLA